MSKPWEVKKDFRWLEKEFPDLAQWLNDTSTYPCAKDLCNVSVVGDSTARVILYTETNAYHIRADKPKSNDTDDYLGMTRIRRDTGACNDKADGRYSLETWNRILRDMLSCELIPLASVVDPTR